MPATLQTMPPKLILKPSRFPVCKVSTVADILEIPHKAAVGLADEMDFVWDIRTPGAVKKELRFFRPSVDAYKAFSGKPTGLAEGEVYAAIFPPTMPTVNAVTISNRLRCQAAFVKKLVDAGVLRALTKGRRGLGGSMRFNRDELVNFLKSRRIK